MFTNSEFASKNKQLGLIINNCVNLGTKISSTPLYISEQERAHESNKGSHKYQQNYVLRLKIPLHQGIEKQQ